MIFKKKMSAVKVPHHKNTAGMPSERVAPPDSVLLPLIANNHRVVPNEPVVKVGDHVYVGQMVADSRDKSTAPIHASVSGTVDAIDADCVLTGGIAKAVRIISDGKMELDPNIKVPEVHSVEEFLQACKDSGIVGLGGAAYPLYGKLNAILKAPIPTVLVNGAECEPYITCDHRIMLEETEYIGKGIELLKQWLKSTRFVIGIEDNKPDAIAHLQEYFKDDKAVEIKVLQSVYPQGAKQVLLFNATGIVVKKGERLASHGCIIINITTLAKMGRYFTDGIPYVERTITVDGSAIANPRNIIIPVGTSVEYAVQQCGGFKAEPGRIILGGPMMGKTVDTTAATINKATNAVVVMAESDTLKHTATPCIHCGRCVDHCPLNLNPMSFANAMELDDDDAKAKILENGAVNACMECGSCSFVCPAHRPLSDTNHAAKGFLKKYTSAKEGGRK